MISRDEISAKQEKSPIPGHPLPLQSPRLTLRLFIAFAITILITIWAVAAFMIYKQRQHIFSEASVELVSAQAIMRAQAERTFEVMQGFMEATDVWLSDNPGRDLSEIMPLIHRLQAIDSGHLMIRMYDENGWLIRPDGQGKSLNSGDRAFLRALEGKKPGTIHIGRPVISRYSGKETLPFSFKPHPNRFGVAYLAVGIQTDRFSHAYSNLIVGVPTIYSLIHMNQTILLMFPESARNARQKASNGVLPKINGMLLPDIRAHYGTSGLYQHKDPFGSARRMTAFAFLDHYPVMVAATFRFEDLDAKWHKYTWIALGLAFMATVILMLLSAIIFSLLNRSYAESRRVALALQDAETANRAKNDFLGKMSHELRTPLNAVIGFSEVIQGAYFGPLAETYRHYGADINNSGHHLLRMIDQILDISLLEAGKLTVTDSKIVLLPLIHAVIAGFRPDIDAKNLTLPVIDDASGLALLGDRRMVQQMLHKLIANAIKYSPRNDVIEITITADTDGLRIAVSDRGMGIPDQILRHILEPFGRGDSYIAQENLGLGIGLPITNSLIEMHNGRLEIDSRSGAGTTVTLIFPPERIIPRTEQKSVAD